MTDEKKREKQEKSPELLEAEKDEGSTREPDDAEISLARYFVWADLMRDLCNQSLNRDEAVSSGNPGFETFATMSYWYGALYVVVEGWGELQLSDEQVDQLLQDQDKTQNLKLYRNATFHFQKALYHYKFLRFMRDGDDTVKWVQALHAAYDRYFTGLMTPEFIDDEILQSYKEWQQKGRD